METMTLWSSHESFWEETNWKAPQAQLSLCTTYGLRSTLLMRTQPMIPYGCCLSSLLIRSDGRVEDSRIAAFKPTVLRIVSFFWESSAICGPMKMADIEKRGTTGVRILCIRIAFWRLEAVSRCHLLERINLRAGLLKSSTKA